VLGVARAEKDDGESTSSSTLVGATEVKHG
jgi:hypothetical protein